MSDYPKRLSGAEYRKRKSEKSSKQETLLNQIPKMSNFMIRSEKLVSEDQQASGSSDPGLDDTSAQDTKQIQSNPPLLQDTNTNKTSSTLLSLENAEESQSTNVSIEW
ncbi:uncharacterized protein LOC120779503 [Bactrocera tryoni]|uniref:uncharacterized protein LOC120779503 n=1 Tax=Bactrocera tryoni TaxID=59916 RepID=UPI001A977781|nr:uncharacterized protein LOC120779503 [Bactrocera tryoni]